MGEIFTKQGECGLNARFFGTPSWSCTKFYHLHSQKQCPRLDIHFPECEIKDDTSKNSLSIADRTNSPGTASEGGLAIREFLVLSMSSWIRQVKIPAALSNKAAQQQQIAAPSTSSDPFAFENCLDFFLFFQFSSFQHPSDP
jgi:hypothetical protein